MARKMIFNDDPSRRGGGFDDSDSNKKTPLMHRQINLAISPKKVFKGLFIVVFLLGVFLLGRLSANNFDLTGLATKEVDTPVEETAAPEERTSEVTVKEEKAPAKEADEPAPEEEEPVNVPEESEPIITDYSKVSFVVNKAEIKWMDTWGKILAISYTIKNNEAGTIKAGRLKMSVEGYTDESSQKSIPFPESKQTIKAGKTVSATVDVPDGFSYHPKTTGNIKNVRLSFILFDLSGKAIASYSNEFDLSG